MDVLGEGLLDGFLAIRGLGDDLEVRLGVPPRRQLARSRVEPSGDWAVGHEARPESPQTHQEGEAAED